MPKSPRCCLQISFNHGVAECPLQYGDENFLLWKMVLHTEWRWISNATGDFPCPFPSRHTKAMGGWWQNLRQGSKMKYGRLLIISGVIASQSMLHERVAPKPPNSHAVVTQVVRVEHAEINIPILALSHSLFLIMLPTLFFFLLVLGLIVLSLVLCLCPSEQAWLYVLTGNGSPVAHRYIHWFTEVGLVWGKPERQSGLHAAS